MPEQSCRMCGCTDRFGCEERCHWVEPDLCSVCSGETPMRFRHYTRTSILRQDSSPVPTDALAIFDPEGFLVGAAWSINQAQVTCRARDTYGRAIATATEQLAKALDKELRGKRWRRGPIARRLLPPGGSHD